MNVPRLLLATTAGALLIAAWNGPEAPSPTAGEGVPTAVLRFRIHDEKGQSMPGRLTFVGPKGLGAELFPGHDARPDDLAVRKDVVYSLSGHGAITVPPGDYEILASRGIEWSLDRWRVTLVEGMEYEWTAILRHEVNTTGWISGDFHLHTQTFSGHGDSNLKERIISLAGEGVEMGIATDHNHQTDFGPSMDALGASKDLQFVTGNEVSGRIGHINAFPLEPEWPLPNSKSQIASKLFQEIRTLGSERGIAPLIQISHPRWRNVDYFGRTGLDPVTATSQKEAFSYDFDALEVMNGNEGWGYEDADTSTLPVGTRVHSVLQDWFNLLNQGRQYAAVGNSDSHTVHYPFAGYPRNYVRSSAATPAEIDVGEVVERVRAGQVFTTIGPFVEFAVNGKSMGQLVQTRPGTVEVHVAVQVASWIDCDRIKIVVNGFVEEVREVSQERTPLRFDETIAVAVDRDSWICVLVEGDDAMEPILQGNHRRIIPLAVTNPVRVEVDGDEWECILDQAEEALGQAHSVKEALAFTDPGGRYLDALLLAGLGQQPEFFAELIRLGLASNDRRSFLAAARCAEALAEADLLPALNEAWKTVREDVYASIAILRALKTSDDPRFSRHVDQLISRFAGILGRYDHELVEFLPGQFVEEWMVIGYFPRPAGDTLLEVNYGPEDGDLARTHIGKDGEKVTWQQLSSRADSLLDLREIDPRPNASENSIAYAMTWVKPPRAGQYAYTLGTDDGCRLWIGDDLVFEDTSRKRFTPMQTFGHLELKEGWNRILLKIAKGTQSRGFGAYFRILDDEIIASDLPR